MIIFIIITLIISNVIIFFIIIIIYQRTINNNYHFALQVVEAYMKEIRKKVINILRIKCQKQKYAKEIHVLKMT